MSYNPDLLPAGTLLTSVSPLLDMLLTSDDVDLLNALPSSLWKRRTKRNVTLVGDISDQIQSM